MRRRARGTAIPQHLAVLWSRQTPAFRGLVLMCVSTLSFSAMHGLVRFMSTEFPPFQLVFLRSLFGLAILLPLLFHSRLHILRTARIRRHALLGLISIASMLVFFSALATTPLARVTALSFTAPIFVALLSVPMLGERFRAGRLCAVLAGFAGMLIILRPGLSDINTGAFLVVVSAFLWAVGMIVIKVLSRTETSVTIVAWMGIFLCLFSLGPALLVWQPLTVPDLVWMSALGLSGSIGQICLGQAFKETDPTVVMPVDFLRLIWTVLIGAWFFSEVPDMLTWVGAVVIFASGLFIALREREAR